MIALVGTTPAQFPWCSNVAQSALACIYINVCVCVCVSKEDVDILVPLDLGK